MAAFAEMEQDRVTAVIVQPSLPHGALPSWRSSTACRHSRPMRIFR